ncbi:Bifunctional dihydrofolate reductase-thymidylate synthase 1 [Porphyridium purpureum]|uniref:Bifunctional dihydrofolate reductase-thymidylate synthase n=1 Tax=Porphyridium purpureum TaxID=35688 RepID=A0A5J4Z871_PORPP|nr:Bifunctional dihydrofolate reductase-thymidylate synthase 1 [Porphyridium purpureum]|eukprot:POR7536..scf295_1
MVTSVGLNIGDRLSGNGTHRSGVNSAGDIDQTTHDTRVSRGWAAAVAPSQASAAAAYISPAMMEAVLVVAAANASHGIGKNGALPWKLAYDMARFKRVTMGHVVLMGRKTYESIPAKFRPLPGRLNIVLTRNAQWASTLQGTPGVWTARSLDHARELLDAQNVLPATHGRKVFVIGGEQIYRQCLARPEWSSRVMLTRVFAQSGDEPGAFDAFFPDMAQQADFEIESESNRISDGGTSIQFVDYTRVSTKRSSGPHEEMQYLELVREIIEYGAQKSDRTGTGTRSVFGRQMRFSLRNNTFPLLTTKRVFWRGVAEEMLWFVRGSTDANLLAARGIHIWDGNGSREFLDSLGLTEREPGDLGPVYGFQWRHFGATYSNKHADYAGQGVDQLQGVIDTLRTNPNDRRMVMSAWNPAALSQMALPPCHMFAQFYVNASGELSCQMYQRSCDMGLGVPFNIASYALLTIMVAHIVGLQPGEFVHVLGDAHVYNNHIDALLQQLERQPRAFPKLLVKSRENLIRIDDFTLDDFVLEGYNPHGKIKMDMAV